MERSIDPSLKQCPKCDLFLSRDQFNRDKRSPDGLVRYCQSCDRIRRKPIYNPDQIRSHNLKRNYGITLTQFNALLDQQNGVCAICGGPPTRRGWHVDHDHQTGVIRGILCNGCNIGLGGMRDNPAVLRSAAAYIERDPPVIPPDPKQIQQENRPAKRLSAGEFDRQLQEYRARKHAERG